MPDLKDIRLAELVGVLLGDVCISNTYQNRMQITLNSSEIVYATYLSSLLKDLFGVVAKIKPRKKENALDVQIFNKEIVSFLVNKVGLVTSPKWKRALIPKLYQKKEFRKYILRGYFDTDGSLAIVDNNGIAYPRIEMKICPSPMRDSLIRILGEEGFRFGAYIIDNGRTRIQMNGKNQTIKWVKEIGIANPMQAAKLKEIDW